MRAIGASVRRCHDCRRRWAWIGSRAIPLRQNEKLVAAWGGVLVMSFGLAICLLAVWWMVVRLGELSH